MTAIADRLATSSSLRSRLRACRSFLLTPGSGIRAAAHVTFVTLLVRIVIGH